MISASKANKVAKITRAEKNFQEEIKKEIRAKKKINSNRLRRRIDALSSRMERKIERAARRGKYNTSVCLLPFNFAALEKATERLHYAGYVVSAKPSWRVFVLVKVNISWSEITSCADTFEEGFDFCLFGIHFYNSLLVVCTACWAFLLTSLHTGSITLR